MGFKGRHPKICIDRTAYFEAIHLAIATIQNRFDQPGCAVHHNLEDLLLKHLVERTTVTNCSVCVCALHRVSCQHSEGAAEKLGHPHCQQFSHHSPFIVDFLRCLSPNARSFFKEFCCVVVSLITVMPSTSAVSEHSFSMMRHIKSYLKSTTKQSRLNHTMVLNVYQEQLDKLDMVAESNEFVSMNEHCNQFFGKFV